MGASMIALVTYGQPSTSPQPVMPASVEMRTISASCELSVRAWISGRRRYKASTSVIFIGGSSHGETHCKPIGAAASRSHRAAPGLVDHRWFWIECRFGAGADCPERSSPPTDHARFVPLD